MALMRSLLQNGVYDPKTQILEPQGVASCVGSTLCKHASDVGADIVVVGSRGYGATRKCGCKAVKLERFAASGLLLP